MPRNSSGVYSLPSGNPVITGTTITSTWANTTMPDLGNEITNSLDRAGRGSMTGQLKAADGTQAAPGMTWGSEPSSGFFRGGPGSMGLSVLNTLVGTMTATGVAWALALGTAALPSLAFSSDPNTGIYSPGADQVGVATAGTSRVTVNATGNVTINAPTSGAALTVTALAGGANGTAINNVTAGAATDYAIQLFTGTGATGFVGIGNSGVSNVALRDTMAIGTQTVDPFSILTSNGARVVVSSAGNVTLNTPDSGVTFTANGPSSAIFIYPDGNNPNLQITHGAFGSRINASSSAGGAFSSLKFSVAGTDAVSIANGGNVTIAAPSSGDTLVATTLAGTYGLKATGSISGNFVGAGAFNTSNTASSDALLQVSVGGSSAGDPIIFYQISGVQNWAGGIDNSDSDTWKLDSSGVLGTSTNRFNVTTDGRIYGNAIHNNGGGVTGTTNQYFASGTYTPTLTNVSNVAASTAFPCQWLRVGNVVTVSGIVQIDPTSASTLVALGVSLPIASNFTNIEDCAGTTTRDSTGNNPKIPGFVSADVTNDRAQFNYVPDTDATNLTVYFHFTYEVL